MGDLPPRGDPSRRGVFTACMYGTARRSPALYAYPAGVLCLLAGIPAVVGYFMGRHDNIVLMLSGVGGVSAAVWMFVPNYFSLGVVPIALGILLILRAGADILQAIVRWKQGTGAFIAKLCIALLFLAAGIVACVDPFPRDRGGMVFAGVLLAVQAACSLVSVIWGGLFREEEAPPRALPWRKDGTK